MDPASLALGVFSAVDICVRYGKELVSKYRAYSNADREIHELATRTEHHWLQIELEIIWLRDIWPRLPRPLQQHQERVMRILEMRLYEALTLFARAVQDTNNENPLRRALEKKPAVRKTRFAWSLKSCMEKAASELDEWHRVFFDPSWFLMLRIPDSDLERLLSTPPAKRPSQPPSSVSALRGLRDRIRNLSEPGKRVSVFLPNGYVRDERESIRFCSAQISQARHTGRRVLLDRNSSSPWASDGLATTDASILAGILGGMDPSRFGLLACLGVIPLAPFAATTDSQAVSGPVSIPETSTFEFVFDIPPNIDKPQSLRSLLIEGVSTRKHSLNDLLRLSKQLASSVLFLHTSQFVHKNIRPETIVVFESGKSTLGSPFLVGFERFRAADGQTQYVGDMAWEKNLYRHPTRQGAQPEEAYNMLHDVYSLGVCLLEIGLWISFVEWTPTSVADVYPRPSPQLGILDKLSISDSRRRAFEIKSSLINLATEVLPTRMGARYSKTVVACLTCLDTANSEFGGEADFEDSDDDNGVLVGVQYIEKILQRILEIRI